jgi:hypothetical protein
MSDPKIDLFNSASIGAASLNHFTINSQITVVGFGLAVGESITFEMVAFDVPARAEMCDPCNVPSAAMPEALAWQPLMCCGDCNGYAGPMKLTSANPVVVLSAPTNIRIRAVYNGFAFGGAPLAATVYAYESNIGSILPSMQGCCPPPVVVVPPPPPVPPPPVYCPSLRLDVCGCSEIGFAYRTGDSIDPAATVAVLACDGTTAGFIYPAAGVGHTVAYEDSGVVLGYMQNQSACAPEQAMVINNYVTTNVAAPTVNNAFAPTTNVAAPTVVLPAPTVASQVLDANDAIVTTLTNGTVFTTPLSNC